MPEGRAENPLNYAANKGGPHQSRAQARSDPSGLRRNAPLCSRSEKSRLRVSTRRDQANRQSRKKVRYRFDARQPAPSRHRKHCDLSVGNVARAALDELTRPTTCRPFSAGWTVRHDSSSSRAWAASSHLRWGRRGASSEDSDQHLCAGRAAALRKRRVC